MCNVRIAIRLPQTYIVVRAPSTKRIGYNAQRRLVECTHTRRSNMRRMCQSREHIRYYSKFKVQIIFRVHNFSVSFFISAYSSIITFSIVATRSAFSFFGRYSMEMTRVGADVGDCGVVTAFFFRNHFVQLIMRQSTQTPNSSCTMQER